MANIIKESFELTNKYIILATPLILFSLISSLYLVFSAGGSRLGLGFAAVLFFLMFCAFLAGWLNMVTICVKERNDNPNEILKYFTSGVGEYFLPVIGALIISIIVGTILFTISTVIGYKLIGSPNVSVSALSAALTSVESMKAFLSSLSTEQLLKINLWNLLLFLTIGLTYFVIMFYPTALFFKTKNPLKAFLHSQKDLFSRHFLKNAGIYLFVFIVYFILSVLTAFGNTNVILYFVFTLVNFYYMVFASILLFNYYYSNYMKIGSNFDQTV